MEGWGEKRAQARLDTDFLELGLHRFFGSVAARSVCCDRPFCVLSAWIIAAASTLLYDGVDRNSRPQ